MLGEAMEKQGFLLWESSGEDDCCFIRKLAHRRLSHKCELSVNTWNVYCYIAD